MASLVWVKLCHCPYLHRLPHLDALRTGEVTRRRRFCGVHTLAMKAVVYPEPNDSLWRTWPGTETDHAPVDYGISISRRWSDLLLGWSIWKRFPLGLAQRRLSRTTCAAGSRQGGFHHLRTDLCNRRHCSHVSIAPLSGTTSFVPLILSSGNDLRSHSPVAAQRRPA